MTTDLYYGFVIDTDSYAGTFEKEMCAYLTGRYGECGVGSDMVEEIPMHFENVIQRPDDHNIFRPTSVWLTPKEKCVTEPSYQSVIIYFSTEPTKEQINFMRRRVEGFAEAKRQKGRFTFDKDFELKILGFRLLQFATTTTEQEILIA